MVDDISEEKRDELVRIIMADYDGDVEKADWDTIAKRLNLPVENASKVREVYEEILKEQKKAVESIEEMAVDEKEEKDDDETTLDINDKDVFKVEKLMARRVEKGIKKYRVRWVGFKASDDTWEPAENIDPDLVEAYENSRKRKRGATKGATKPKDVKKKKTTTAPKKVKKAKTKAVGKEAPVSAKTGISDAVEEKPKGKEVEAKKVTQKEEKVESKKARAPRQKGRQGGKTKGEGPEAASVAQVKKTKTGLEAKVMFADGSSKWFPTSEANEKFPLQIIKFYESCLKFKEKS